MKKTTLAIALALLASTAHAGMFDGFVNNQVIDTSAIVAAKKQAIAQLPTLLPIVDTNPEYQKLAKDLAAKVNELKEYAEAVSGYDLSWVTTEENGLRSANDELYFEYEMKGFGSIVAGGKIYFSEKRYHSNEREAAYALATVIALLDGDKNGRVDWWLKQIETAKDVEKELDAAVEEEVVARCGK